MRRKTQSSTTWKTLYTKIKIHVWALLFWPDWIFHVLWIFKSFRTNFGLQLEWVSEWHIENFSTCFSSPPSPLSWFLIDFQCFCYKKPSPKPDTFFFRSILNFYFCSRWTVYVAHSHSTRSTPITEQIDWKAQKKNGRKEDWTGNVISICEKGECLCVTHR